VSRLIDPPRLLLSALVAGGLLMACVLWSWSLDKLVWPLMPTAILAAFINLGGPHGFGGFPMWFALTVVATQVLWTCMVYVTLGLFRATYR
jgi:hypothetical protein